MAKSKNHTNHNQNYKDHRNGIKKPKKKQIPSRVGMDLKFLKNQKYALSGSIQARFKAKAEAKKKAEAEAKKNPKPETKKKPKAEGKKTPKAEGKKTPKAEGKKTPKAEGKKTPKAVAAS